MAANRFSFRVVAASLAVFILAGYLCLSVGGVGAGTGRSVVKAAAAPTQTLVLSKNGVTVASYPLNCGSQLPCNEIEYDWKAGSCPSGSKVQKPLVTIVFTTGTGQFSGVPPAVAPCKVNDIEFTPMQTVGAAGSTISNAWWTRNGVTVARILPPQVSLIPRSVIVSHPPLTGIHTFFNYAKHERLTRIRLRHGSRVVASLKVPSGANQVDWYGYPFDQAR